MYSMSPTEMITTGGRSAPSSRARRLFARVFSPIPPRGSNSPSFPLERQNISVQSCSPESTSFRVAVLGAGHGGLALAGWLSQLGHRVALWNRTPDRIAQVAATRSIQLALPDQAPVSTTVALATTDLAAAMSDANLILLALPACAHADMAIACAPLLRDGQSILLVPGRTGGALEFRRILQQVGCKARILLGECNTFPLAARCIGPTEAVVFGIKDDVQAAALPAERTGELMDLWSPLLPMLGPARSVLHTGFANVGAILHPTITLLNAERIARGESFDFYAEGVSPRVAAALEFADAERLRITRAYGLRVSSLQEWIASAYGHIATDMRTAVGKNPAYVGIKAPLTLEHRYLLDDVPNGLIPLIELGEAAGVAAPTLRRLVAMARAALGDKAWRRERNLDELGLAGWGTEEIRNYVLRGSASCATAAPILEGAARVMAGVA